jgi:hypothetical protein
MKRLITVLIILITINTSSIFSQCDSTNKHVLIIKTDIFIPILAVSNDIYEGALTVEYGFNYRQTVQITACYVTTINGPSLDNLPPTSSNEWSLQITPEYKFFIKKNRCYSGLYTGGYFKVIHYVSDNKWNNNSWPYKNEYLSYKGNELGCGLLFGYQNYYKHLVYDILIGVGYRKTSDLTIFSNSSFDIDWISYSGIDGLFALNVGYRFY